MDEEEDSRIYRLEEFESILREMEENERLEQEGLPAGRVGKKNESGNLSGVTINDTLKKQDFGALDVLARLAAAQPFLPLIPNVQTNSNKFINIIDPPKDLAIDGEDGKKLTALNKTQKKILQDILRESFFKISSTDEQFIQFLTEQEPIDDDEESETRTTSRRSRGTVKKTVTYKVIGDAKEKLVKKIQSIYKLYFEDRTTKFTINRISKGYTGGINPLENYFICQDNGPTEIFSDSCIFVNTPGSVMDPAFRQTSGANVLNLLPALNENMILPYTELTDISLDTIINQGIQMTRINENNLDKFSVEIPFQYLNKENKVVSDSLTGKFLTTKVFESQNLSDGIDYFSGNRVKNGFIYDQLINVTTNKLDDDPKKKIIRYILAKEIGDTLLVKWLDYFLKNNKISIKDDKNNDIKADKVNTLVNTSDTVVWLRCIINGIGCVYTHKDISTGRNGSTIYPTSTMDQMQQALTSSTYIESMQRQISRNNNEVINEVEKIQKYIENYINTAGTKPDFVFLQITIHKDNLNFLNFSFKYLIYQLKKYNTDLLKTLAIHTNMNTVKEVAKDGEFILPFVRSKTGEYVRKVSNNHGFLANKKFPFNTSYLTNTKLSSIKGKLMTALNIKDENDFKDTITFYESVGSTKVFYTGGASMSEALARISKDSQRKTYNFLFDQIQRILNGGIVTRKQKIEFARNFYILRQLRLLLLQPSRYRTNLIKSENPDNDTDNKGEKIIDAAILYAENKRVSNLSLPTPPSVSITASSAPNPFADEQTLNIFRQNYTLIPTTDFLHWFISDYMPSIFHAGICLKLALRSFNHATEKLNLTNYGGFPIQSYYELPKDSKDYFKRIFTKYIRKPDYDSTSNTWVFSEPQNTELYNQTEELLAYAKYFYQYVRPEACPSHIKAFFAEIDNLRNQLTYIQYLSCINLARQIRYNLTSFATWGQLFTLSRTELFTPEDFDLYNPLLVPAEDQQGGDNNMVSVNTATDSHFEKIFRDIVSEPTSDFINPVANELYDYYYDLENMRCLDNLPDYTTYIQRRKNALAETEEFLKDAETSNDKFRAFALKGFFESEIQALEQTEQVTVDYIQANNLSKYKNKTYKNKHKTNFMKPSTYTNNEFENPLLLNTNSTSEEIQFINTGNPINVSGGKRKTRRRKNRV